MHVQVPLGNRLCHGHIATQCHHHVCSKIYWYSDHIHKIQPYSSSAKTTWHCTEPMYINIGSLKEHLRPNEPSTAFSAASVVPMPSEKIQDWAHSSRALHSSSLASSSAAFPSSSSTSIKSAPTWPSKGASPAPGDGRSCCCAGFRFLETARPSAPRLPNFFSSRPLGFPMVLACVFCVVRAAACAVVVLCTQRKKGSPHGAEQQKCEYLENQIFPSKNQTYPSGD